MNILRKIKQHFTNERAIKDLKAYTDWQLRDLGIDREQIRETVTGKRKLRNRGDA